MGWQKRQERKRSGQGRGGIAGGKRGKPWDRRGEALEGGGGNEDKERESVKGDAKKKRFRVHEDVG